MAAALLGGCTAEAAGLVAVYGTAAGLLGALTATAEGPHAVDPNPVMLSFHENTAETITDPSFSVTATGSTSVTHQDPATTAARRDRTSLVYQETR